MIAVALEVPVVGRALLLSVGLADGAVQVEDQLFERLAPMDLVDPLAGEIHQRREVALGTERLGLEASDSAGGSGFLVRQRRSATDNVTHGRIDRQPLGIVHVFIACQSAVDRLPQLAVGQQASIAGDLAAAELQLQPAVKTDSQIVLFGVTHGVPCHCGMLNVQNTALSRTWRKLHAKTYGVKWEMRDPMCCSWISC